MKHFYRLDDRGEPVAVDDASTWAEWFEKSTDARRIVVTKLSDRGVVHTRVSTVFLGIASDWTADGSPILWETAVFQKRGDDVDIARRYSSRLDAIAGHHRVVAELIERITAAIGKRLSIDEEKLS